MYQPKLYLRFNPPIYNDSIGNRQLDKILSLIENEYPEVTWFEGQSPAEYNPFTDEDEDIPDQIKSLTIGYWPDKTDTITYGMWDDNDYGHQNFIDGWQWLKDREVDYDLTSDIFSSLNESEEEIPKLTYVFEPPIEDKETLRNVLYVIGLEHPGITWPTNAPILNDSIYREIFDDNEGYDFVGGLTIDPGKDSDIITWTSWVEPLASYSDYGPKVDGWQLIYKHIPNTEDVFNNLNESKRQPKLNLRFDEPISDANQLDKVLKVLAIVYPGLKWMGGDPITTHNVIRDQEGNDNDFKYEPIYYLTIGFFSHAPDKLTYTNSTYDDPSFADDEHNHFNWVDGWDWVRNNEVDYDETTDMFNQLNESIDYNSHPLLNHFVIFDDTNTKEDIKYVIDTLINFGLDGERGKKNVWTSEDTDILYEDYIETKMEGDDRLVIGSKNAKNSYDMFIHYGRKGEYAGHDVVFLPFQEFFTITNFNTEDVFNELI